MAKAGEERHAAAVKSLEAAHAKTVEGMEEAHAKTVVGMEEAHAKTVEAMEEQRAREGERFTDEIAALQQALDDAALENDQKKLADDMKKVPSPKPSGTLFAVYGFRFPFDRF